MSLIQYIPLFPFLGFLINGLGFNTIPKKMAGLIGIAASLLSFIFTVLVFLDFQKDPTVQVIELFNWISLGDLRIPFAFQIDELSIIMLFIVTGIGSLIHVYSVGYMNHDEGFGKFFAYLNLFLFSMLLLVLGSNYLILFIGWEGVGLCSYLLIGFWNKNVEFGLAARKAFIMNRVGDLGLLIGVFLIIQEFGTLDYLSVFEQAKSYPIGSGIIIAITMCLFVGAMGKSAQIPLFTWLPDAMAGPTPVSALIHAATMVTSGIYLIIRSNVLYTLSPFTLEFIAWIGVATALIAATIGVFQNDIKKVLAYSTVSQLGYMFIGLGVMAFTSGFFHVITHAFFKALLFLGAGSIIHSMNNEQDIRKMGGLWPKIKITGITFLIGTIAISGIPPFAGFFSKDEILAHVFEHNKIMWALAILGSFLTAFYMFRVFFVTFLGNFRGSKGQEEQIHESPSSMTIPLIVLAGFSMVGGFIGLPEVFHLPHALKTFLNPIYENSRAVLPSFGQIGLSHSTEYMLMAFSVLVAIAALAFAYIKFVKNGSVPVSDSQINGIQKLIYNKYYIDELYESVFTKPMRRLSTLLYGTVENRGVSRLTFSTGNLVNAASMLLSKLQTGSTITYLFIMSASIAVLLLLGIGDDLYYNIKSYFINKL